MPRSILNKIRSLFCGHSFIRTSTYSYCKKCGKREYGKSKRKRRIFHRGTRDEKIALHIHRYVNAERKKHRLGKLRLDYGLTKIASRHSRHMAKRHFFSHTSPDGSDPTDRASAFGYDLSKSYYCGIGENLFMTAEGGSTKSIARSAVRGWMNSSGHRANILNGIYSYEGIGIMITRTRTYVTQNFC